MLASAASESPAKATSESQIPLGSWTEQHPINNGVTCDGR